MTAQDALRHLQKDLQTLGFYSSEIDGIPGPKTSDGFQLLVNECHAEIAGVSASTTSAVPIPSSALYAEFPDGNHNDPWPPPAGTVAFIHKATQGVHFIDPAGVSRRLQAKPGILWGWYHFTSGEDPEQQAANFLDHVSGRCDGDLIVLDFEHSTSGRDMTPTEAETWIQIVEKVLGCKVVVYGSDLLHNALIDGHFANQPLWPARYGALPSLPGGRKWALWQFTEDGRPYSDMNRFAGTADDLRAVWPNLPA